MLPEDPTEAAENGVYVYGLFLEGARYSKETRMLAECEPKVLFVELPMMWLCPTPLDDLVENPHYMCPLYKTSERKGTLSTMTRPRLTPTARSRPFCTPRNSVPRKATTQSKQSCFLTRHRWMASL